MYVFSHLLINCVLAFVGESNVLIAIVLVFVFIHSVLAVVGLLEYNLLIAIVLAFGRRLDSKVHTTLSVGACVGLDSKVHTTLSVGACVGARSDVALTFAQMWEVLDLYTLHLFQCFFFLIISLRLGWLL